MCGRCKRKVTGISVPRVASSDVKLGGRWSQFLMLTGSCTSLDINRSVLRPDGRICAKEGQTGKVNARLMSDDGKLVIPDKTRKLPRKVNKRAGSISGSTSGKTSDSRRINFSKFLGQEEGDRSTRTLSWGKSRPRARDLRFSKEGMLSNSEEKSKETPRSKSVRVGANVSRSHSCEGFFSLEQLSILIERS